MLTIYKTLFKSIFRDAYTIVWSMIVPIGILLGLGYYIDSPNYKPILATSILAITVLFTNFNTPAFIILKQRNQGVYKLLKATPFQTFKFILCLTLATNTISFLLSIIMILLSIFVLGVSMSFGQVILVLLMMIFGAFCFVSLGFLVANLSKNENHVGMYTNLLQFPMIFTSGAFFSMAHAPKWLKVIGDLTPFKYLMNFLQSGIIRDSFQTNSFFIFLLFMIGIFLLSVKTFKYE